MHRSKLFKLLIAFLALTIFATACGGSDDDSSSPDSSSASEATDSSSESSASEATEEQEVVVEEEEEEEVEEAREEDGDMRRRQSELFEAAEKGNDDAVEQLSVVSWWRGCPEARLTALDLTKMGGLCCTWRLNKGTRASFGCCSRSMPIRTRGLGFAELPCIKRLAMATAPSSDC